MDLQKIVQEITTAVGGTENFKVIEHCATRLRFMVKDETSIDLEALKKVTGAKGYFYQTGQHQLLFGTGLVNKVYAEIQKGQSPSSTSSSIKDEVYQNLSPLQKISRIFGDVFIPIIPVIVVTGLFMGLRGFVTSMGIELSPEVQTLSGILTDTAFIFLPVFITWSAFQKFGGSPVLGILAGMILVSPALPNAWAVAGGGASPLMVSLFGIDFALVGYQGSIIAPLLIAWMASWVEKQSRKFVPDILALLAVPLIVISSVLFIGVIILGPILHSIENGVGTLIKNFVGLPFGIGGLIIGFLNQALVITGLHHMFGAVELSLMNTLGYNPLNAIVTSAMGGMMGAGFSIALTKKDKERSDALSLIAPAFFGITEPLLFGLTLPNSAVFFAGLIAGGLTGLVAGIVQLKATGLGVTFIPGLSLYFGTGYMVWYFVIMVLGILLGFLFGKIALSRQVK